MAIAYIENVNISSFPELIKGIVCAFSRDEQLDLAHLLGAYINQRSALRSGRYRPHVAFHYSRNKLGYGDDMLAEAYAGSRQAGC